VTHAAAVLGSVRAVGATPLLVRDRAGLAAARGAMTGRVAVVMTMGALHEGHLSLVRLARAHADHVVVTVFVNPLQFGPGEDLDAYPRTLDADLAACAEAGVDLVFAPTGREVYPSGEPSVRLHAGDVGGRWEGASRPGHFDGVLTVVTVLLNLVRPHVAVFGRKDRQQLTLIRAMTRDLATGVEVLAGDTVREPDGLALSSRNAYLDATQRRRAPALSRALAAATGTAEAGHDAPAVLAAARQVLEAAEGVDVDYCVLVDPERLLEVPATHVGPAVVLVAALVGSTRLIDNADVVVAPR
jgi:pantoate--beta-alanine ligase